MSSGFGVAHLTDTHVPAGTSPEAQARALASLDSVLGSLADIDGLDLVVVSGDIADDGSAAGTEAVRDRIARFASARGLAQIFAVGNTDSRDVFRAALGSGHRDAAGADVATAQLDTEQGGAVSEHHGLRVVTLDSTVPGQLHGELTDDQLSWLSGVVTPEAPHGTLLVMHHPPRTVEVTQWLSSVALRSSEALASVLESSDVRAVLTGHFHAPALGFLGSAPVWVSPAVESRLDVAAPSGRLRFIDDPAASVIRLPHGGTASFVTVHAHSAGRVVREVSL
ncbi:MAG: metallophosphoesterase [Microcella sp.]|uniref:metallophosphoesterase family protein n=1 Tax=Microcella sp. TaxID=1913979 RepID=UPI0024CD977F|nr:metallophosphoesterase [Microcella sp.]UYN84452.1 MAG: metallophosphoesterase [Microcella sp.]